VAVNGWTVWGISVIWVPGGSFGDGLFLHCAPKHGNDTQSWEKFYIVLIQSIRVIFGEIGWFGAKYFVLPLWRRAKASNPAAGKPATGSTSAALWSKSQRFTGNLLCFKGA
jgi:hypothetical protein